MILKDSELFSPTSFFSLFSKMDLKRVWLGASTWLSKKSRMSCTMCLLTCSLYLLMMMSRYSNAWSATSKWGPITQEAKNWKSWKLENLTLRTYGFCSSKTNDWWSSINFWTFAKSPMEHVRLGFEGVLT